MEKLGQVIMSDIYLYICIFIAIIIFITIMSILISNKKKRKQIKDDFIMAEKIEEIENKKENNELESLIEQMQQDIEMKPEEVVKKFEEDQEEKAIISYQELVDNVKQGKIDIVEDDNGDVNFVEQLTEEKTPVIETIEDESSVTPEMVKEAIDTIARDKKEEEVKTFKNSDFISPIYGKMEPNLDYPTVKRTENIMDLMNTKDYNELSEEIRKQEEFLNALIEFRNNL